MSRRSNLGDIGMRGPGDFLARLEISVGILAQDDIAILEAILKKRREEGKMTEVLSVPQGCRKAYRRF